MSDLPKRIQPCLVSGKRNLKNTFYISGLDVNTTLYFGYQISWSISTISFNAVFTKNTVTIRILKTTCICKESFLNIYPAPKKYLDLNNTKWMMIFIHFDQIYLLNERLECFLLTCMLTHNMYNIHSIYQSIVFTPCTQLTRPHLHKKKSQAMISVSNPLFICHNYYPQQNCTPIYSPNWIDVNSVFGSHPEAINHL